MSYVSQPHHELARSPARPLARGCPMGKPMGWPHALLVRDTLDPSEHGDEA